MAPFRVVASFAMIVGWALIVIQSGAVFGKMEKSEQDHYSLYVIFNNVAGKKGMKTSWGFACLVEGPDKTILFDTGGNADILLANMAQLGLDPKTIDAVVLSHLHRDHTGGLGGLLSRNADVTVYMPASFPKSFQQEVKRFGASVETVSEPRQLLPGVFSTGVMGAAIKEQALIVDTSEGLIVITGCAHPNVADMVEQAETYLGKKIYLLMGGFHLGSRSGAEIDAIIQRLKAMGVKKVSPSHCTGENAIDRFREKWADDFIEGGLGAIIEVQQ